MCNEKVGFPEERLPSKKLRVVGGRLVFMDDESNVQSSTSTNTLNKSLDCFYLLVSFWVEIASSKAFFLQRSSHRPTQHFCLKVENL